MPFVLLKVWSAPSDASVYRSKSRLMRHVNVPLYFSHLSLVYFI